MKTSLAGRIAGAPAGVNLQNPRDLLRRFFSIVGFAIFTVLAQPFPATADTDPTEFIDNLGNQALAVLQDGTSLYQKQTYFHQLFDQDFRISIYQEYPALSSARIGGLQASPSGRSSSGSSSITS